MDSRDRLLASLGNGSFASVKCYVLCSGMIVAVKAYSREQVQNTGRVERVLKEKEILLRISGQHCYFVCSLIETRKDEVNLYFVLEACLGGSLHKHLSIAGSFDITSARCYIAQLAAGLLYLSRRGVMHRDFKLNNVLLDKYGHVKICDFGSAKILYEAEAHKEVIDNGYNKAPKSFTLVGSLLHMSPEMISKKFGYTICSDWYSLGVIAYELLFGTMSSENGRNGDNTNWQFISIEDINVNLKYECINAIEDYNHDNSSGMMSWGLHRLDTSKRHIRTSFDKEYADAIGFMSDLLIPNPAYRLGPFALHALLNHDFLKSYKVDLDELLSLRDGSSMRSPNKDFDRRLGYLDVIYIDDVEAIKDIEQNLFNDF